MVDDFQGFSKDDIRKAFDAFNGIHSYEDIVRAVDNLPVFSSPVFHAMLLQEMLRLKRESKADLSAVTQAFDDLFLELQIRQYLALIEADIGKASPPNKTVDSRFAPPFFDKILAALAGRLPKVDGPRLDPCDDMTGIHAEIREIAQSNIQLPQYRPSPGSLWSLLLVACGICDSPRLELHAHAVDLKRNSQLLTELKAGRINNSTCSKCGSPFVLLQRPWIQERPAPSDPLGSVSCLWLTPDGHSILQTPPGTRRDAQYDRVLEIRFDRLRRDLSTWSNRTEASSVRISVMAIVYSVPELCACLVEYEQSNGGQVPFEMMTLIYEVSRKLQSGVLPISQCVTQLQDVIPQVGRNWPITMVPVDQSGDISLRYNMLVHALISEECAKAKSVESHVLALLAGQTAQALFLLGEIGMGETALERARAQLSGVPTGTQGYNSIHRAINELEADFLSKVGRHREAFEAVQEFGGLDRSETASKKQLDTLQLEARQALAAHQAKRFKDALEKYEQSTVGLESLEHELQSEAESAAKSQALLQLVRSSLSGALANWAGLLMDLTDLIQKQKKSITPAEAVDFIQSWVRSLMADEVSESNRLDEALPVLSRQFGDSSDSNHLRSEAMALLERALVLSKSTQNWEFAGIQAHRLGFLCEQLGRHRDGVAFMLEAAKYANDVRDRETLCRVRLFLAKAALSDNKGHNALTHLATAVTEEVRHTISLGYHTQPTSRAQELERMAFLAVDAGGAPGDAVMLAEALKSIPLAVSLSRGHSLLPSEVDIPHGLTADWNRLREKRESLRIQLMLMRPESARSIESFLTQKTDLHRDLATTEYELEKVRHRLRLCSPQYLHWCDSTFVDVPSYNDFVASLLRIDPNAVFFGAFPGKDSLTTCVISKDGCELQVQAWPQQTRRTIEKMKDFTQTEALAEYLTEQVLNREPDRTEARLDRLNPDELGELFFGAHAKRLARMQPSDKLLLSIPDSLAGVSFAQIPIGGRPLCTYAVLMNVLGGLLDMYAEREPVSCDSLLCIGDPTRPDLPDLPGAREETEELAALFRTHKRPARTLLGDEASVVSLSRHALDYDVLHFACHSTWDVTNLSRQIVESTGDTAQSQLGANLRSLALAFNREHNESGDLTESRVNSEIRIKTGCLVNLAACSTASTRITAEYLPRGLIGSFMAAGARCVLGNLWPVEDTASVEFQTTFYEFLLKGITPPEALATTQRSCIDGRLGTYMTSNKVWAGYVLYGIG